jgi:serine/threonine protein kinase
VKFLRKSLLHQRGVVERFVGEARTIAKLRHPNIVGIHGLGRTPGGSCFLIMDLVNGPNLAILGKTRTISVEEATRWAIQTCHAIEHAHAMGIIHCDLKPANILLDDRGSIRVTDFGLARSLTEHTPWTAEIEGTAPFMAPEQASRCWGPIDTRTDIYGVGAVLYALLTDRPPWVGRRLPDILADVISAAPVLPATSLRPDLPEPIVEICRKCLSKPPEDRYLTVQDLRAALIGTLTGER